MIENEFFYKESNYIDVNLCSLKHNYYFLKQKLCEKTAIIAMVKSNAYGHGIVKISQYLEKLNVDSFGVFTINEAKILRNNGIKKDIIIFGPFLERDIPTVTSIDLSLVVGNYDEIKILQKYHEKKQIKLHIKIDTGMGRIGFLPDEGLEIIQDIYFKQPSLVINGICTHFSDSSSNSMEYTVLQGNKFIHILEKLENKHVDVPLIHAANSAAILHYPQFHFNAVRPGILLYGVDPFIDEFDLKPVLSLHSYVSAIKTVPENSYISYNRTFKTKKNTKIAIIPFGYADGYLLSLSNKSQVSINKQLFPIIGNICMNQFVVDISTSNSIHTYDPVVLIEGKNNSPIGLNNLSILGGTIPYEILCRLPESIFRNYTL